MGLFLWYCFFSGSYAAIFAEEVEGLFNEKVLMTKAEQDKIIAEAVSKLPPTADWEGSKIRIILPGFVKPYVLIDEPDTPGLELKYLEIEFQKVYPLGHAVYWECTGIDMTVGRECIRCAKLMDPYP